MRAYKGIKSLNFNASLSESGQLLIRPADEDCLSRERFACAQADQSQRFEIPHRGRELYIFLDNSTDYP